MADYQYRWAQRLSRSLRATFYILDRYIDIDQHHCNPTNHQGLQSTTLHYITAHYIYAFGRRFHPKRPPPEAILRIKKMSKSTEMQTSHQVKGYLNVTQNHYKL